MAARMSDPRQVFKPGGVGPRQVERAQRQSPPGGHGERSSEKADSTSKRMCQREGQPGFLWNVDSAPAPTPAESRRTEGETDFPDDDVFNFLNEEEERTIEERINRILDWYNKEAENNKEISTILVKNMLCVQIHNQQQQQQQGVYYTLINFYKMDND